MEQGTRQRILDVAEDSFGDHGYHGTRLHKIAERVGIQKASLFHYFPSKEHLYRAVVDEGFGETERTIKEVLETEASPLEKARLLVEAYVDIVAAHPNRTKMFLRQSLGDTPPGYQPPDTEPLPRMVATFVSEAQRAHIFAPLDPMALVLGVVGMAAFFFTSAPAIAPAWSANPCSAASVNRVKQYMVEVVERSLAGSAALAVR